MSLFTMLDRYIARHLAVTIALTLLVLTGLGFIGLFIGNLGQVGQYDFGYDTLLAYVLLNLPAQIYEIMPAAALVGTSAGLSMLALSSELTAIRAAGVSLYRIFLSVLKLCLLLVAITILLGEWIVPGSLEYAEKVRSTALHQPSRDQVGTFWLRDRGQFVRIVEVLPDRSLRGITIVELATETGVVMQIKAARAVYRNNQWLLQDVALTRINGLKIQPSRQAEMNWQPSFDPVLMQTMQIPQQKMSTWDLLRYVNHLNANEQDAAIYELSLWKKLVLPFSTLIMVMLAVPFVFGSIRTGGLGRRVFIGVLIGFAFSLLQSGMGYYSLSFGIPPAAAALTPSLIFLGVTAVLFYRAVRLR